MKQFSKVITLSLGLGILAIVLSPIPNQLAFAEGRGPRVTVVNTPLPVQGTVNANVAGSIDARITNTTVPVSVVNTPAQPVPTLATDAQSAFVASVSCLFLADACAIEPLYTVPMSKTAVIESASGVCVTNSGTATREFQLRFIGPGGSPVQLSFPPSPAVPAAGASTGSVNIAVSAVARNLKSYASGGASGTPVNFAGFASANQTGSFPGCVFTVSGHLVSTQ